MPTIEYFCSAGSLTYDGTIEWVVDADLGLTSFSIGRLVANAELEGPTSVRITYRGARSVGLSNPTYSQQRLHMTYQEGGDDVYYQGQSTGVRALGPLESLFTEGDFWSDTAVRFTVAPGRAPRGTQWSCAVFWDGHSQTVTGSSTSVVADLSFDPYRVIDSLAASTRDTFAAAVIDAVL